MKRLERDGTIINSSIEADQRRPRASVEPRTIRTRYRRRTDDLPRLTTLHPICRKIINSKDALLARVATGGNRGVTAGKTAVLSQLLDLLLDHGAPNASHWWMRAPCVSTVCHWPERKEGYGEGSACDLDTRPIDVRVRHAVLDPVLKVGVDMVGGQVVWGTPYATSTGCFREIGMQQVTRRNEV